MKTILIKINPLPSNSGLIGFPFSLSSDAGVVSPSSLTYSQLIAGEYINVPDDATNVIITSLSSLCPNTTLTLDVTPCYDPLEKIFQLFFIQTNTSPLDFENFLNTGISLNTCCAETSCPVFIVGCVEKYLNIAENCTNYIIPDCVTTVIASVETYLKYAEAVGLTSNVP